MSNYFSLGFNMNDVMSIVNTANMQAAYNTAMNSYMTGSIFNMGMPSLPALPGFDMNTSLSTPAWLQNVGQTFPQFDFSGLSTTNPFAPAAATSSGTVTDEDGEQLTVKEYAAKHGYDETATEGVYKKGGKYYRYNASLKRFSEVSKEDAKEIDKAEKVAEYKEKLAANKDKTNEEAKEIANEIYSAMKGWGTNDTKLAGAVARINKDNVIEVWDMWNKNHEEAFGKEGGLMKSIQNDTSGNDERKYRAAIKEALIQRANELGLSGDADDFATSENFEIIIKAIKEKEAE